MPFLGREMGHEPDYSDEVAREIDKEIRRVIEEAHDGATRVLQEHMEELHRIAAILIERETIGKDQFARLTAGESEESVFPEERPSPSRRSRRKSASACRSPSRGRSRRRVARSSRRLRPSRPASSRRHLRVGYTRSPCGASCGLVLDVSLTRSTVRGR